jgi:WD40 repeat protein
MAFTTDGKHLLMAFGDQMGFWDTSKESFPKGALGGTSPLAIALGPDAGYTWLMLQDAKILWVWQVARLGTVNADILGFGRYETRAVLRHTADVQATALSPDREVLAAGIANKTIRLWNVDTKKEVATCKGHTDVLLAVEFSPDGKTLASASKDGTVRLWQVTTGKELAVFKGHDGPVRSVCFSPDGNTLASGGDDKTVALWDVKTLSRFTLLKGHTDALRGVAFSRDGNLLASASKDKTVCLWGPKK